MSFGLSRLFRPGVISLAVVYVTTRSAYFLNPANSNLSAKPGVNSRSLIIGNTKKMVRHLGQQESIDLDNELFNDYKFSVDQLMEMAGISVATVVAKVYGTLKQSPVIVICGPGNNGGDGMVAARHLKLFGFENVTILNTRKPSRDLFIRLIHQAESNDVNISYDLAGFSEIGSVALIIDALFGFSFKPPVRPDSEPHLKFMAKAAHNKVPVVSVDIPSGWNVECGPENVDKSMGFMPDTLISLTAPKLCAKYFKGSYHYLGGRFVPKKLEQKYQLNLPSYPEQECVIKL